MDEVYVDAATREKLRPEQGKEDQAAFGASVGDLDQPGRSRFPHVIWELKLEVLKA